VRTRFSNFRWENIAIFALEPAPGGAKDLSPALQRWVKWEMNPSPGGTTDVLTHTRRFWVWCEKRWAVPALCQGTTSEPALRGCGFVFVRTAMLKPKHLFAPKTRKFKKVTNSEHSRRVPPSRLFLTPRADEPGPPRSAVFALPEVSPRGTPFEDFSAAFEASLQSGCKCLAEKPALSVHGPAAYP
jgi:hypothetical protein